MISDVASNFLSVTGLRILSRILDFLLRVYLIRNTLSPIILSELVALDLIMTISLYISKSCFKPSYQQIELQNKNYNIIFRSFRSMTFISGLLRLFSYMHYNTLQYSFMTLSYGKCQWREF